MIRFGVPDHWHSTIAIDALNAGKDVYVEKPLTLKIEEGPPIVKAARINNRICQVGMQQRSGKHYLEAKREYMDTGKLGKVTFVFKDVGQIAHDFAIAGKSTPTILPGHTTTLTVTFTKPGRYSYFCTLPGHAQAGMSGVLIVK